MNPGPMSEAQAEEFNEMFELLQELNIRSMKLEEGQAGIFSTVK